MLRLLAVVVALLVPIDGVRAEPPQPQDHVGDTYEIRLIRTTESFSDDRSSSSSQSGGSLTERVVAVHDDGLELEFDLPPDSTDAERAQDWRWPARILKSRDGSLHLLNAEELEARIGGWLAAGGFSREACGSWIFTWNAFKIECDPQSVLDIIVPFDLRLGDLREGGLYDEQGGIGPVSLQIEHSGAESSVFVAETPIDPEFVRRERAEADVVVGGIIGDPTTLEAAYQARAADEVTGTITTTLTTDSTGRVTGRTTVTDMTTVVDGVTERSTSTRMVERRPI